MIIRRSITRKGVEVVTFNKPNKDGEWITLYMWDKGGKLETKVEAVKNLTLVDNNYDPQHEIKCCGERLDDDEGNRRLAIRTTLTRAFGIDSGDAYEEYEKGVAGNE